MRSLSFVVALAIATLTATPALAHPKLISANPAPNAVKPPKASPEMTCWRQRQR